MFANRQSTFDAERRHAHHLVRLFHRCVNQVVAFAAIAAVHFQCTAVNGAPVTFQFNAEIASAIHTNGGAGLPFAASPGDLILATFEFEPANGGPDFPQSGALRFDISGHVVSVPNYVISVRDENVPNGAPLTGRIADPANTPIVDQAPGSSDNISLACASDFTPGYCGSLNSDSDLSVHPVVLFSSDDDILQNTNLVAGPAIWNQFTFREMSLSFLNAETGGRTYVGAYIGTVQQVPEAGTLCMALVAAFLGLASTYRAARVC